MQTMSALYVILHIITIIAVIIFILHTAIVHNRINKYITNLEKILKDNEVLFIKEVDFRKNVTDTFDRCINLLTLCNNTNHEVISKLRNSNKDKDNKFNVISSKLTVIQKELEDVHKDVTLIQNEAKFSCNTKNMKPTSSSNEIHENKLKTARKWHYSKEGGEDKENKK